MTSTRQMLLDAMHGASTSTFPPDATAFDHGNIVLLRGETKEGREWIERNINEDVITYAYCIAIEANAFSPIITGLKKAGLTLQTK